MADPFAGWADAAQTTSAGQIGIPNASAIQITPTGAGPEATNNLPQPTQQQFSADDAAIAARMTKQGKAGKEDQWQDWASPPAQDLPKEAAPQTFGKQEQPPEPQVNKSIQSSAGMVNQLLAAFQGASPVTQGMEGDANYKRLGTLTEADFGHAVKGDDGSLEPFDPTKHITFLDDKTAQPVVYERNPNMENSTLTSLGRLFGFGALAPNPVKAPMSEAPTMASRAADFEHSGIAPNIPAITQNKSVGLVAKTLSNVPVVGAPITKGIQSTLSQAAPAAERIASTFGEAANPEEGGQALQSGIKTFIGDKASTPSLQTALTTPTRDLGFQNKASALYDAIPIRPTTPILPQNTLNALNGISSRFPSNPALGASIQPSKFKQWQDILSNGKPLTWDEMKQFRSYVGRNIRQPPAELGLGPDDMKTLYGGISKDLEATATAQGPDASKAFSRANNYYSAGLDRINNALDAVANADSPEKAFHKLTAMGSQRGKSADVQKLSRIMRSLPPEAKDDVASSVIRRLGTPNKGMTTEGGASFSIATFVSNYADIADKAKDALFGPKNSAGRESLDAFARTMGNLKNVERLGNPSGTAGHLMTGAGLMEVGHAVSSGGVPYEAVVGAAVGRLGAKALMSPMLSKWLVGASKVVNTPQFPTYVERLKLIADQQPFVEPFYQGVANLLRQSAVPAGAQTQIEQSPESEPNTGRSEVRVKMPPREATGASAAP